MEESELLHLLLDRIQTVYVSMCNLGGAGAHLSWATPVWVPARLRLIVIDNPAAERDKMEPYFWRSVQKICITARDLQAWGLEVAFLFKDFSETELREYEQIIAQPGMDVSRLGH